MSKNLIYMLLAVVAGIAVTVQGPINTILGKNLKNSNMATFWSFFGGTVVLAVYFLISRQSLPTVDLIKSTPWWTYLGAITGIIYVALVIYVTPALGVGRVTVLLLIAQTLTALFLDHIGAFGFAQRPIDLNKIVGLVLMIAGVVFINK